MRTSRFIEFGFWLVFLVALFLGIYSQLSVKTSSAVFLKDAANRFEFQLQQELTAFDRWIHKQRQEHPQPFISFHESFSRANLSCELVVKQRDSLVYWGGTRLTTRDIQRIKPGYSQFDNLVGFSWKQNIGDLEAYYVLPLKNQYLYENQFLKNDVQIDLQGNERIRLVPLTEVGQVVHDPNGEPIFKISLDKNQRTVNLVRFERYSAISFLMAIVAAIIIFFIRLKSETVRLRPWQSFAEFIIPIVFIRGLLFHFRAPIGLTALELFDPNIFASHWLLPSFGDLLLHLLVIGFGLVYLWRYREVYLANRQLQYLLNRNAVLIVLWSLLSILFFLVSLLIARDLVFSSAIPMGLELIFDYNLYTYLAILTYLLMIGINAFIFYVLFKQVLKEVGLWRSTFFLICVWLVVIFLFSFTGEQVWLKQYWLWWVLISILYLFGSKIVLPKNQLLLGLLLLFSLFVGFQVSEALYRKQIEKARYTARKIYSPNDTNAIYLLLDLIPRIQEDPEIRETVSGGNAYNRQVLNRLQYYHLKGYLEKYQLSEVLYLPGKSLEPHQMEVVTEDLMHANRFDMLRQFKSKAKQGYSLRIPFVSTEGAIDTLVFRLIQKSLKPDSPFPSLLLEGDLVRKDAFNSFSFALYENGQLIQQGGKYPYQLISMEWDGFKDEYSLTQSDFLSHFIYKPDEWNTIVVSFSPGGWLRVMALSSGLMLFSLMLWMVLRKAAKDEFRLKNIIRLSFRNRIEIALIGSVISILMAIGYITVTYTVLRTRANTEELITNRLQDVQIAIESSVSLTHAAALNRNQIMALNEVSANLMTDFSVYDTKGKLIYSSQDKIFERGLLSELAHPEAYFKVVQLQQTLYSQDEKIGDFAFKSAYLPLRDAKGSLMGMLHLPSFDTNAMERVELNEFVGNLMSLYFIVIMIAVALVFMLSERITSPIKLLTEVILQTKATNVPVMTKWKRSDEIGVLLASYNEMLEELNKSAKLLARSERESAWREMARQIAHEIRNPLTPMKLKLQRMLRDFKENPQRFDNRFSSEVDLVLEQIDVLAAVANEFGSFAQVQIGEKAVFNVLDGLNSVINLFEHQADFSLTVFPELPTESDAQKHFQIFADPMQMQRVFQNLIKNGIQSVPNTRTAQIDIRVSQENEFVFVEIADNGNGISEAHKEKIFQPNFTTKSSGMGLGLAIVKKILEQNDGVIDFVTMEGEGSRFTLRFPVLKV